jgi:hypothetical protein
MRGGILPDDVLVAAELAILAGGLMPLDVPGFLQFHHGGTDSVLALQADPGEAREGIIPGFREGKHKGEKPFCFQREALVPQMMVAHDGIIMSTLYTENCHSKHSYSSKKQRAGKQV